MSLSTRIRQTHRWVSVGFTLATIVVIGSTLLMENEPAEWLYFLPLPFLALLLATGLYLFVLPYLSQRSRE